MDEYHEMAKRRVRVVGIILVVAMALIGLIGAWAVSGPDPISGFVP